MPGRSERKRWVRLTVATWWLARRRVRHRAIAAARAFQRHAQIVAGAVLTLLPFLGVLWVAGLPGSKTPEFVNFAVQAHCHKPIEPTLHIQIPAAADRTGDLVSSRSDMRFALQLFDTLGDGSVPACMSVHFSSSRELISPHMLRGGADPATTEPLWFYLDAVRGYDPQPVTAVPAPDGHGL